MSIIDSFFSIKCKKGIFAVILTALILTVFEMILFYKVEAPVLEDKMREDVKTISKKVANNINNKNKASRVRSPLSDIMVTRKMELIFNDTNKYILKTFAARERMSLDTINLYTLYSNVVLLLVLLILLYFIWSSITNDENIGIVINGEMQDADMTESVFTALFTVVVLIGFYILFYFFSHSYNYLGSFGNEEVLWDIFNEIEAPT
jgi:hypothetical protein